MPMDEIQAHKLLTRVLGATEANARNLVSHAAELGLSKWITGVPGDDMRSMTVAVHHAGGRRFTIELS